MQLVSIESKEENDQILEKLSNEGKCSMKEILIKI